MKFQSTPAIADGRSGMFLPDMNLAGLFQSTPAIADGRSKKARLNWRVSNPKCFNPRPPLLTGEATRGVTPDTRWTVSIHARHC